MQDSVYASFCRDPDFWRKRAPLSHETMALLGAIFVGEQDRISLCRLKQTVEQIVSFYMPVKDIVSAGRRARKSARRHGSLTRLPPEEYTALVGRGKIHRGIGTCGSYPARDGAGVRESYGEERVAIPWHTGTGRTKDLWADFLNRV